MAAELITFANKVDSIVTATPRINKTEAADWNETKSAINTNAALIDSNTSLTLDYVLIKSVSDLTPYLVGDEYVLPTGLVMLNGTLDLVDKAVRVSTGTILRGLADAVLISSNSNGVVRATNVGNNLIFREFNVVCTTGACFVLTGTIDFQLNMFFVGMFGVKAAIITGFNVQGIKGCYIQCADGITFQGTTIKTFVSESPFYNIVGSAVTLDSTLVAEVADIETCFFKFDSPGIGVTAEVGYSITEGLVRGTQIAGTAIPLVGLAPSDLNWEMAFNTKIADSKIIGEYFLATAVSTVITTINVPVKVAAITTGLALNERMTATNNRLTYTGLTPTTGKLLGTFTVDSGNNVAISFYLAKNGIVMPASKSIVRVSTGADTRAGTVSTLVGLVTGDFIEIWAENNTNTDDLTCLFLNLNIIG